jgi:membrane fusion protein, multidrug efflux system
LYLYLEIETRDVRVKTIDKSDVESGANGKAGNVAIMDSMDEMDNMMPAKADLDSQQNDSKPKPKPKKTLYFLLLLMGIGIAGAAGLAYLSYAQGREETEDSYVDGHITTISSRVAGVVTKVLVEDNQLVTEHQPLVRLDPNDYQVRVNKLHAALTMTSKQSLATGFKIGQSTMSARGQAIQASGSISSSGADWERSQAALLDAQAQERQASAHVRSQLAQVAYTESDYERYKTVYANRAVTKQQFDKAGENWNVAKEQLKASEDALDSAKKKVLQARADITNAIAHQQTSQGQYTSAVAASKQTDIDKQQYQSNLAAIEQAKSDLDQANLDLSYTKIDAPLAGRVGRRTVEVGQHLEVGQALMSIVQPNPWITANFKETQLNKMKVGQEVEIKIDSFPGKIFKGRVDSFSPASGAKFSVLPPDNATGNFIKVVQRIPVKIVFDKNSLGDYESRISPGMSCITTVIFK